MNTLTLIALGVVVAVLLGMRFRLLVAEVSKFSKRVTVPALKFISVASLFCTALGFLYIAVFVSIPPLFQGINVFYGLVEFGLCFATIYFSVPDYGLQLQMALEKLKR